MLRAIFAFGITLLLLTGSASAQDPNQSNVSTADVVNAGHRFFDGVSGNVASAIEYVVSAHGEPKGYILGEEASGAFIGGLRYGEGVLYTADGLQQKIYWQGPSVGFDAGGDGNRTMMLVYSLHDGRDMYRRFVGVDGSAYLVGGLGVTVLRHNPVTVVPIRSGVGARLGVNVGYLKFTETATWNPF